MPVCRAAFAGGRLGERCDRDDVVVTLVEGRGGVVGRRLRQLDVDQHVGVLVLHRLEGGDRPAELHAHLRVGQRILAQPLGHAGHLVGQAHRRLDHGAGEGRGRGARRAEQGRLDALEIQRASLRVGSITLRFRRSSPLASPLTVNSERPASPVLPGARASTTMRSAVWPSMT